MYFILVLAVLKLQGHVCETVSPKSLLVIDILKTFTPYKSYKVIEFSCVALESATLLQNLAKNGHYGTLVKMPTNHIPYYVPPNSVVYIIELSCRNAQELLRNASKQQIFSAPYHWVLMKDLSLPEDYFADLNFLPDSDVTICTSSSNRTFEVKKVYRTKENLTEIFENYASWSIDEGLLINNDFESNAALRRRNLNRTVLKACLVIGNNDSLNHLTDRRDRHIDTSGKVHYTFMQHMGDFLNAQMRYTIDPSWGYAVNDTTWEGMIGQITNGQADIGGTSLFLTQIRVPVVDYVAMTNPTNVKFIFRQPKLSYITNIFKLPFVTTVWISSLALVLFMASGLYLMIKWEWYKKRMYGINDDDKYPTDTELQDSMYDVCFLAYGAVCQQGSSVIPFNNAGRTVTVLLFISLMFLFTAYSANIVSLLQSDSTSIQTLTDLLNSPLQIGLDETAYNHFYFSNASDPVRKAIYHQKVAPPGQKPKFMSIEEGVRRMRQGLFAFHVETGPGYTVVEELFLEDEKCGIQEIQFIQTTNTYSVTKKNSSYKEMVRMGYRKLHESGIQNRELSLMYVKKPPCTGGGGSFISVGIIDCYFPAVVFAGGAITSVMIFVAEILHHKYAKRGTRFLKGFKNVK